MGSKCFGFRISDFGFDAQGFAPQVPRSPGPRLTGPGQGMVIPWASSRPGGRTAGRGLGREGDSGVGDKILRKK
jgi:hypothetical protein